MNGNLYKFHLYEYGVLENKRFLGALCCRSEDVVEAGVVLHLEPVIKVGGATLRGNSMLECCIGFDMAISGSSLNTLKPT